MKTFCRAISDCFLLLAAVIGLIHCGNSDTPPEGAGSTCPPTGKQPVQLSTDQAFSSLVDGGRLFVGGTGVFAVDLCSHKASLLSISLFTSQMQLNAGRIYWVDNFMQQVSSVSLSGGAATSEAKVGRPDALVKDDQFFYWSSETDGTIQRRALDGGEISTLLDGRQSVGQLLVDETTLYWVDNFKISSTIGGFWKMPKAGGTPERVLMDAGSTHDNLAQDADFVYYVHDGNNGTIQKIPKTGGDPFEMMKGQIPYFKGVAVDKQFLYTGDTENGLLFKIPLDGGDSMPVASGQHHPRAISLDATSLYWVSDEGSFRLAK